MNQYDIPQVTNIDREAFPTMWPPVNFTNELRNRMAHYVVACDGKDPPENHQVKPEIKPVPVRSFLGIRWPFHKRTSSKPSGPPAIIENITGFIGLWLMVDESHIINIAVKESDRGNGIGELLLISGIDLSIKLKASVVTLEVRTSNTIAQNLYQKYGFSQMGVRKGYYTDNKEDALIMTTDIIKTEQFLRQFRMLKEEHFNKLGDIEYQIV
ncbi:MAG: ribosomal protein S18-alanine N-acetyltransferase [Dehalococcoidales bacterium]|nr:ribosomal protein S18-alanine N-acetyltransferase [Dehalococcoidales bacterium]